MQPVLLVLYERMEEWSAVDETSKSKSGLWLMHVHVGMLEIK